jgi:8-amino-7-oxononanoate synthase
LSLIAGLCGAGDVLLIARDSHARISDAPRQTAAQVIGFRHNSAQSLRKKLERLPGKGRNRLVVVEGLYSIRGDVAPLREIIEVCREYGAYVLVDEAHSLGTYGRTGLGCAEDQGVLDEVDFIVGTFSKSLAGIGGVFVSNHPELRALHFLTRAYVFTASGSPSNVASVSAAVKVVRAHPELREQLWANVRRLRQGLRELGYVIGDTESPIVPIITGDEERTIGLWQRLLHEGLYVNLIVPPGCPVDECVLCASCAAAHTPEQLVKALGILGRVGAQLGVTRAVGSIG